MFEFRAKMRVVKNTANKRLVLLKSFVSNQFFQSDINNVILCIYTVVVTTNQNLCSDLECLPRPVPLSNCFFFFFVIIRERTGFPSTKTGK